MSAGYRDQSLDARPPFSPRPARRTDHDASTGASAVPSSSSDRRCPAGCRCATPTTPSRSSRPARRPTFPSLVNTEQLRFDGELRVEHALNATQTLRAEYQRWDSTGDNLGVGEFELPERAFSEDSIGNIARLSAIGTIGRHLLNELRLEYVDIRSSVDSLSNAVGINVPNAFRSGGAQRAGGRRDQEIEIAQTIDLISHPKHKVRFGFETELGWTRTDRIDNYIGTFTFASLDDLQRRHAAAVHAPHR